MKALLLSICISLMVGGSAFSNEVKSQKVSPKETQSEIEIEEKGFIYINKMPKKVKVHENRPSQLEQLNQNRPDQNKANLRQAELTAENDLEEDLDQTISELSHNKEQLSQLNQVDGLKMVEANGDPIGSFMQKMQGTMMTKLLKENPLKMLPRDQMRATFLSMIDGTPYKKIMQNNPKLMNFTMDWLVDDNAIKGFLNIPSDQKRMKNYLYILLAFFIGGFFLNLYLTRNSGLLKKIVIKLFMLGFTFAGNISIFYFMFKKELDPTLYLVKKHFIN